MRNSKIKILGLVVLSLLSWPSLALEETNKSEAPKAKVKYRSGQDVNFEEMLIQGQLRRPEISVVTGNTQQGADGLLRLRDNFTDRLQMDAGEEL